MRRLGWTYLLFLPGLVLLGAAAGPDPFDLVREGNAAYAREEYTEALDRYALAEGRISDPGLAAYNQATVLYRLGQYRDAELHYQCCLSDADGPRRVNALFGLGNSLLQQGRERGADALREAVRAYAECVRECEPDSDLADNARHNLELAKLLLSRVPPKMNHPDAEPPRGRPNSDPYDRDMDDPWNRWRPPGWDRPDFRGKAMPLDGDPGPDPPLPTDEQFAGSGTMRPVPDTADQVPLLPHDAEQHLNDAVRRIREERRAYLYRLPGGRDVAD